MSNMEIKINEEKFHPATPEDLLNKVKIFENEEDIQPIIEILEQSSPKFINDTLLLIEKEVMGTELAPLARDLYGEIKKTIKKIFRKRSGRLPLYDEEFLQKGKMPLQYTEKRMKKNFSGK